MAIDEWEWLRCSVASKPNIDHPSGAVFQCHNVDEVNPDESQYQVESNASLKLRSPSNIVTLGHSINAMSNSHADRICSKAKGT